MSLERAEATEPSTHKFVYLDALRGLASIIVVLAHYVGAFYPWAIFGQPYQPHDDWEKWLQTPPLSLVMSGHFAVCLFFILSGYVLSVRFLSGRAREGDLVLAALKRPVRLGGMVLFTVFVGYALMCAQLLGASQMNGRAALPWLDTFWSTTPSGPAFARDIILEPFASSSTYNPPLWTIHKELVGSYIVFAYIALGCRLGRGWRIGLLLLVGALTFRSLYVGFAIGIAFAEATAVRTTRRQTAPAAGSKVLSFALLAAGLWLGAQPHYQLADRFSQHTGGVMSVLEKFGTGGAAMLGAALTFAAVWHCDVFQRALDRRLLRNLGRISFAVYALHFLLLGTLAAALHRSLVDPLGWHAAAIVSSVVSLACLFPLAELLTRWIDRPSMAASNVLASRVHRLLASRIAPGREAREAGLVEKNPSSTARNAA